MTRQGDITFHVFTFHDVQPHEIPKSQQLKLSIMTVNRYLFKT